MEGSHLGITFRETMSGGFALGATDPEAGSDTAKREASELAMHATITIRDLNTFTSDPTHLGDIQGTIDFTPFGEGLLATHGTFNLFAPTEEAGMKYMVYELGFEHEGEAYYLAGKKEVRDDPGFDLWSDTTTLFARLHKSSDKSGEVVGAGVLSLGVKDLMTLVSTMRATGTDGIGDKAKAYAKFGSFFLGELWDSYKRFVTQDSA